MVVINTNVHAQRAAANLSANQSALSKSLARLSSGSKIVSPADDAAGLAVATRIDAQTQRIDAAKSNVGNAISFSQTQDGFLKKMTGALDRMSELSILAQDITKSDSDRTLYNQEFQQLASYIGEIPNADFNGVSLFSANPHDVTVDSEGTTFSMTGVDLSVSAYTDALASNISTTSSAATALDNVKAAISQISFDRATLGSIQSRLNFTSEQLTITKENLMAASSLIKDVDVAEEATEYARAQILVQSGTAMLAQANSLPNSALQLLRG